MSFSIPVSELTLDLLSKAEYWRFMQLDADQHTVAETLHRSRIEVDTSFTGWNRVLRLQWEADDWLSYDSDVRCFPVTLSPDGTETRLECPRMPDDVEIDGPIGDDFDVIKGMDASGIYNGRWDWYWPRKGTAFCLHSLRPPTPEHYPRRTYEGVWVWSTRR